MRILVTNDDGIHAPGLWSVVKALKDESEIVVIAPDRDQSGVGTAVTLLSVVRAQEIAPRVEGVKTFSVEGTPSDCVILATETLVSKKIDLVVSGINQGANLGLDVTTSGTVGAALQAYMRNIPSVAVSVASLTNVLYEPASQVTRALARGISQNALPAPFLLNVNLPNVEANRIERVDLTKLGPRAYMESVERGGDSRKPHYWIKHNRPMSPQNIDGTDVWAVRNNRVSITPLDRAFADGGPPSAFGVLTDLAADCLGLKRGG